jgi:hypothetical protein
MYMHNTLLVEVSRVKYLLIEVVLNINISTENN